MLVLQIDKMAYGGSGFGRLDGKACFVPFTAPGDMIEVRIETSKSSYFEGVVEKIIGPSNHRTSPPCPVFGICGGCNWQHITYEEQCSQKETIFADTLWRAARIGADKIRPVLKAPSPFAYRQRIQLKSAYSSDGLLLGFYKRASHDVVDINDHCEITANSLNAAIRKVRDIIESFKQPAHIHQVDLAASADSSVSALFHYSGSHPEALAEHLAKPEVLGTDLHSVNMQTGSKKTFRHINGLEKLVYSVPSSHGRDIELYFSPDSFSQINFAQNKIMVQLLLDYCSKVSPESILDLYCGNGNFSLPLAGMVKSVRGYESVKKSVSLAEFNATVNGATNTSYLCKDSLAGVHDLAQTPGRYDLVIMDPPRTGADQLSRKLHRIGAAHIIYISCDPPTLGRDLAILQSSGFEVTYIQPVDMFPQTYHLESIVFLKAA